MSTLIGVDTNVLVRAYQPGEAPQKPAAQAFLESLGADRTGFVTLVTFSELFRVLHKVYRVPRTRCLDLIRDLAHSPSLEIEDGESLLYALDRAYADADFDDALIAVTHELFGTAETVTFDKRAAKQLGWELLSWS